MPKDFDLKLVEPARGRRDSDGILELSIVPDDASGGLSEEPIRGETFGKYMLVGELATGGMAEVYLGVQRGLQGYLKVVTIKRMLPHLNGSPDFVSMFIDEARLGARLEHTNIVRTYEFGEHEGQYFTVMEYLPGEDVAKLLNRAAGTKQLLPLNLGVHVAMQVCAGLHFAHELTDTEGNPLGLVHRDVNPSNIIITYSGEVKLIDFGVAKSATNESRTVAGTIKGKLQYMAPEQVLGRGVDRRSDVFSTGVVLWELLTARPLFARDNEGATLHAIITDPIPNPRQFRPEIPRDLDAMVMRALARDPNDRFDSCETMIFALESFLGTQPKIDPRAISRLMESMFGTTRANAKRSIAQTRSLRQNVSLVMKLRTDVRRDLVAEAQAAQKQATGQRSSSKLLGLVAAALIVAAGGIGYLALRDTDHPTGVAPSVLAKLELESTPSGAAVFVGSEPTGLRTPAVLADLPPGTLTIRLELDGHRTVDEAIEIRSGDALKRTLVLQPMQGRLVLSNLPASAEVWVDGKEQVVGEVINALAGSHEVRIDIGGKTVIRQTVESTAGDQVWTLDNDKLIRR